ncbi:MAG TPA: HEAT repeat domain-containing protein [Gemmataceae bacterium]
MRRILTASLVLALLVAGVVMSQDKPADPLAEHIAPTDPLKPEDEVKTFHLPSGFEAQLVASEPDIHKPLNIAFDDKGRLWVSETVEYPFAFDKDGKPYNRDAVKILEDFGPDGRARKITTFADKLNIPIGLLPLTNYALLFSIPDIWRVNYAADGQAGERRVFLGEFGRQDTHGLTSAFTVGFDGWIYACHGYANNSTVAGGDKQAISMNSGNVYRFRADGSHAEYFTHGQVNPFGITLDPLGNLYTCDCHTKPAMMLLRGGYYDSFGKPHDGLGYAPEMVDRYDDSTAIAGIAYYAADHYPAPFRDNFYIGDVVTNNIVQFTPHWFGSSPKTTMSYFLKSDDRWFRPVAITLGPDGALYVADFYNRIIGHYEVPLDHPGRDRERGRIWRIIYRGVDGHGKPGPIPDFTKKTVADLVKDLSNPNLTVRMKAANQLVERPDKEIETRILDGIGQNSSPFHRMHGLWVLERRGALDDKVLAAACEDIDRGVRIHAMRVLSERNEVTDKQREMMVAGLKDADPFVQRAAADALGRHPKPEHMDALLHLRATTPKEDTHLIHTARMAQRDTLLLPATWEYLAKEWAKQDPKQASVEKLSLVDIALGAPTPESAAFLLAQVVNLHDNRPQMINAIHHVARNGGAENVAKLVAFAMKDNPGDLEYQSALFHAIEQATQERKGKLSDDAHAWAADLTGKLLASAKPNEVLAGITLAGSQQLASSSDKLAAIAANAKVPENQRVAAFNSLATIDAKKHTAALGGILADANEPLQIREQSALVLARLNDDEAQKALLDALPAAPARLQGTIAVALASNKTGADKLLDAVQAGKASARLLQERPVEIRLGQSQLPNLKERIAKLTQGLPPASQRMQELMVSRRKGFLAAKPDADAGAKVFEKSCAICHQLANKGAKIGPQLDGIGIRGIDRLLEDILDPNRNVDQAFRATRLDLKNGQTVTGLLLREEGEVLVLADNQGKEIRIEKSTVDERITSPFSPMPDNFVDQVSKEDFYNLLAFLLKQQTPRDKNGEKLK